ncbi:MULTISPECIES: hypothetical protein [Streptomyces]|uniref:DUF2771 domain-containing protein n=2 Tax=Streptomyces TaxID=1883 RepID=A0ABT9KLF0_9ACTN|nr:MULTISPECIES: hypothetical protein [Streptomyces]MBW8088427.1 hypothetical protein [Streptomyces hygroscopicus subsp. hygroscopicus]MCO8301251.1 hypothetical protein [Streptomyces sp. RKCA744]MDN3052981.1 hypothetical protein [Streptomyces sp. SRF1]MDP9609252.1 hypothetical protein [Streptomyces demainii]GHJ27462.1 lipoprotein [Streptomyces hygroscopicus]
MTAALFSRGKGRRAVTAACAVSLGLVVLSACDKPTPLATVTVGSNSVTAEANKGCYGDGKDLSSKKFKACLTAEPEKTVKVAAGEKVRIGVDPEIADSGWGLIANNPVMAEASKETYRSFDSDTLFAKQNPQTGQTTLQKKVTITIAELGKSGQGVKGIWRFTLERDS